MSHPPLGERTRLPEQIDRHFDSHTGLAMGDHEHEILEIPYLPPPVWEVEPSSTYGTPIGSENPVVGISSNDPSQFTAYMSANHRY